MIKTPKKETDKFSDQDTIKLLDKVDYVLETKIKNDIHLVEKVLEKRQYLVGLNQRLIEIINKLEELKDELSSKR